jgi:hypothetical protein
MVDILPMIIEHGLNQSFVNGLHKNILHALFAEGNLANLLDQDHEVVRKRESLRKKRDQLLEIKKSLEDHASGNVV